MAVTEEVIIDAARRLADAASSHPAQVILFGSYARGQAHAESDLDFLVVEPHVARRRAEAARLRCALLNVEASVDILVASEAQLQAWGAISGTVFHEALTNGKVLVDGR